jgi:Uma2 family endonuclease
MQAGKLATYDDLVALPEGHRAEILGGVIVTPPSPLPRHGRAQRVVGRVIGGAFDDDDGHGGPGGWWILPEVDVRLSPHDIVRPDVAGWRRERLPEPWDLRPIDVVPDWICEILSPSNVADDRVRKRRLYAEHGVAFYWLLDPAARTLEALRLDGSTRAWMEVGSYDGACVARVAPFDGIEIDVGRFFPPDAAPRGGRGR